MGLTGSIGTGKSFVAAQFEKLGAAIFDADKAVHELLGKNGEAVEKVAKEFPETKKGNHIDRKILGSEVFFNKTALKKLEKILHPLVAKKERELKRKVESEGRDLFILDIPLLFETGADKRCDKILVLTAPFSIQKRRVMARANMTEEKFRQILAYQMQDKKKIARADYVINTGLGPKHSLVKVKEIVAELINSK